MTNTCHNNFEKFDRSKRIFIDANIFVYYLVDDTKYSNFCEKMFDLIYKCELKAAASAIICDEVYFALMKNYAYSKLGSSSKLVDKLRKNKNLLSEASIFAEKIWLLVSKFSKKGDFKLYNVLDWDYKNVSSIIQETGLLPHDAMHLYIMRKNNLEDIATFDQDFLGIDGINVWA